MNFKDLTLHPHSSALANKLAAHLPQGLIIDGPSGSGVLTVAKSMATSVGSPLFVIEPKKKVKGEFVVDSKEGSVIIEDIRRLYKQTRTRQPGRQVYIIDTGEKSMTVAAQNAFLKLLEEPREGIHFIIATHQLDQLLPTIVSRCQRLILLPVTEAQTMEIIDSLSVTDPTKRTRLAFVGKGRPALIHRLVADNAAYDARIAIMSDAKTMLGADTYQKLMIIHRYRDNRGDALTLIDDMNHQLKKVLESRPDKKLVTNIEKHLHTRSRIAAGGNIRLHLAANVI